jgi:hypothetical protein
LDRAAIENVTCNREVVISTTSTQIEREWIIAPPHAERQRLANEARVEPLVAQVLLNRGIKTASAARRFLSPEFPELLAPDKLPNAVEAATANAIALMRSAIEIFAANPPPKCACQDALALAIWSDRAKITPQLAQRYGPLLAKYLPR